MKSIARKVAVLGMLCFFGYTSQAQSHVEIPTEVFAGHEKLQHEYFFFSSMDQQRKWGIFSTARFIVDYQDSEFNPENSSFINSLITYNFTPNWGIAGGAFYADRDVAPTLAGSYTYLNQEASLFINLFPSRHFREDEDDLELFGFLIYKPKITETLSFFTQFTFSTVMEADLENHLFSYQQLRLGLGIRDWLQTGLGVNIEPESFSTENIGIFIRKELK